MWPTSSDFQRRAKVARGPDRRSTAPAASLCIESRLRDVVRGDALHLRTAIVYRSGEMLALRERQEWKFFSVLPRADTVLAGAWWVVLLLRGALPAIFGIA